MTESNGHGFFPLDTLIEKAAVDNGFDRRLQRQADILRFRSTHHAGEVLVSLTQDQTGIGVWVGREVFSVRLLDLAGVGLREPTAPCPWKEAVVAPSVLVSLKVAGVAGVRRLFSLLHQVLTGAAGTPGSTTGESTLLVSAATDRALHDLPANTEINREVIARIGQEKFRAALIDYWEGRCALTGCSVVSLLRASHIKPWAKCETSHERLNAFNGLLLLPNLDAAFDGGLITFDDEGCLEVSPVLPEDWLAPLSIVPGARLSKWQPAHRDFMRFHRNQVFLANPSQGVHP